MRTVRLQITGRVQGVWFRASAKDAALSLGITGKVWNNPDDSVGAFAQGPEDKISEFIEWCKKGPQLAKVENVLVHEITEHMNFTSFEISRPV